MGSAPSADDPFVQAATYLKCQVQHAPSDSTVREVPGTAHSETVRGVPGAAYSTVQYSTAKCQVQHTVQYVKCQQVQHTV